MATNPTVQLFSSSQGSGLGLGFLDSQDPALSPPPPPVEVLSSEASSCVDLEVDKMTIGEITLLKLWEGSINLVKALEKESQTENLSFSGKRVLELGCGHALPGIYACLKGSDAVHFQDFNDEVLLCLTIPNLNANLSEKSSFVSVGEIRFFAGEWSEVHQVLSLVNNDGETNKKGCYDIILMAEMIYSGSAQKSLYELIKRCLAYPDGAVYMAAKKYYFGVGDGTRQFLFMIEKDGVLASKLVVEVTDGSSNVREVWKLSFSKSKFYWYSLSLHSGPTIHRI